MVAIFDPNIFLQGAQMREAKKNRMFDMLSGAIGDYQKREDAKAAKLESEKKEALDPSYVRQQQILGMDVSPEQLASLAQAEEEKTRQRRVDALGNVYSPYAPVGRQPTQRGMRADSGAVSPATQNVPAYQGVPDIGAMPDLTPEQIAQLPSQGLPQQMVDPTQLQTPDLSGLAPVTEQRVLEEKAKKELEFEERRAKRGVEKSEAKPDALKSFKTMSDDAGNMISTIDKAIEQTTPFTAGLGSYLGGIAGTPAADLSATLDTVKADSAFDRLQQMRDSSKTGGALGAISEKELSLLQNARAALTESQSPDQLRSNLERYRDIRKSSLKNVAEAYKVDYGDYPEGYTPDKVEIKRMSAEEFLSR